MALKRWKASMLRRITRFLGKESLEALQREVLSQEVQRQKEMLSDLQQKYQDAEMLVQQLQWGQMNAEAQMQYYEIQLIQQQEKQHKEALEQQDALSKLQQQYVADLAVQRQSNATAIITALDAQRTQIQAERARKVARALANSSTRRA